MKLTPVVGVGRGMLQHITHFTANNLLTEIAENYSATLTEIRSNA